MKLRYLLALLAASLLVLAGCDKEELTSSLKSIQVSKTYLSIIPNGGKETVKISSSVDWTISSTLPDWLKVSPASGKAGSELDVVFSADSCAYGRQAEVQIKAGPHTQFITVRQGEMTVETVTCAQAMTGTVGKTYRVKGAVTSIINTTYGNLFIDDGSGVEAYIYGTLDKDGKEKNFSSLGIEIGDVITVEGPLQYYGTTAELVNVTVVSIQKSLLKISAPAAPVEKEGGIYSIKAAYKGNGVFVDVPAEYADWIALSGMDYVAGVPTKLVPEPADTAVVKFKVAANNGADRAAVVNLSSASGKNVSNVSVTVSQKGSIIDTDVAGVLAGADNQTYRVSGYVSKVNNTTYGNFMLKDYSGELTIYGTNDWAAAGIKEGDVVTVYGPRVTYNTTIELKNVTVFSHRSVTEATVAEFNAAAEGAQYYKLKGTVSDLVSDKGRFNITDNTGSVYAYNVAPGFGGKNTDFATTNVKDGDIVTIIGTRSSYKGTVQVANGFFVSIDNPQTSPWAINLAYTLGADSFDDGTATINGDANNKVLKIGTSSKVGEFTLTVPAGSTKLSYYAVAWKDKPATLEFSINGTVINTQAIAANAGATGSYPYTLTVANTDKYELSYSFTSETTLKVTTASDSNKRAILFAIKAE